jgi:hypothetical protein
MDAPPPGWVRVVLACRACGHEEVAFLEVDMAAQLRPVLGIESVRFGSNRCGYTVSFLQIDAGSPSARNHFALALHNHIVTDFAMFRLIWERGFHASGCRTNACIALGAIDYGVRPENQRCAASGGPSSTNKRKRMGEYDPAPEMLRTRVRT